MEPQELVLFYNGTATVGGIGDMCLPKPASAISTNMSHTHCLYCTVILSDSGPIILLLGTIYHKYVQNEVA